MYSRLLNIGCQKSFFLFGPRGTGKTTWVRTRFPGAVYIDLLEAELYNKLLADPHRLETYIHQDDKKWIIIDEIQRVPELLNEVHRLIEKKKYRFILTGSSARKLRRKGTNLLGGRALLYFMHPLTVGELGNDFDLTHSLRYGHLPCACTENDPKKYLESYVSTYLREEIQQEALTRNIAAFSRFLESASFSQGSVLNISSVARDCAIERKVVENYFNILEDLLVAYRIPVFTKKAKRRMIVHPKFYFFDTGVFRAIRPSGPLDMPEEIEGMAFETLFLQELVATNEALQSGYTLYYWRTSNCMEVDFVLYGEKGLLAFEIKRTGRFKPEMLSGLRAFKRDYPSARTYFVYGGSRRLHQGGIDIIPITEALQTLQGILRDG